MEVILREHIDKLGRRGEVVKVADGYARNYLLPRKLALPATEGNKRHVERERKIVDAREAKERQGAQELAAQIAALELAFPRRVGEGDTLYGSVTSADVAEALIARQFDIDKRKVQLHEPLKQLGEFKVPVKLHHDVVAEVTVKVVKLEETA